MGAADGSALGLALGAAVGDTEGDALGEADGLDVGDTEGDTEGDADGDLWLSAPIVSEVNNRNAGLVNRVASVWRVVVIARASLLARRLCNELPPAHCNS